MNHLVPDPPEDLIKRANISSWPSRKRLFRCHDSSLSGDIFNPRFGRGGRFHWFEDVDGNQVPILYAASTYEGAIAETILRNVPLQGRRTLYRKDYQGRVICQLSLDSTATLALVQLHDPGLLRLGIRPKNLTETNSYHYARTANWARAVHHQLRHAQGLVWMSGRFNTAYAIVLFGDRVDQGTLRIVPQSPEAVDSGAGLERLVDLARSADITVARIKSR